MFRRQQNNIFLSYRPDDIQDKHRNKITRKKFIYSCLEDNKTTLHAFIYYIFVSKLRLRPDSK